MLFKVTLAYKKCEFTSGVTMIFIIEKTHNIDLKNKQKKQEFISNKHKILKHSDDVKLICNNEL